MATSVLAFAETRGGEIRKIAYEAVSVARALAALPEKEGRITTGRSARNAARSPFSPSSTTTIS